MTDKERTGCPYCRSVKLAQQKLRLRRHLARKAKHQAEKEGIESGKVIVLYLQDEFTGIHYRTNKHGQTVMGGRGRYN